MSALAALYMYGSDDSDDLPRMDTARPALPPPQSLALEIPAQTIFNKITSTALIL